MPAVSLSDLPDDRLRGILHFAPVKEAASTSALSRRWRTLWLSSGALNLDSRTRSCNVDCRFTQRNVFRRDASAALAAYNCSGFPLRKLTYHYEEPVEFDDDRDEEDDGGDNYYSSDAYEDGIQDAKFDMVYELSVLLRSEAARDLEELYFGIGDDWGMYSYYSIADLQSSLRVLHITNCMDTHMPAATDVFAFPRLTELRLHLCQVSHGVLKAVVDAAPLLSTLLLHGGELHWWPFSSSRSLSLNCPKLTTLVLSDFNYWGDDGQYSLNFDAPMLRYFTYQGHVRRFSLKSPMPYLTTADVHLDVSDVHKDHRNDEACKLFWEFMYNFSSVKKLKLIFEPCIPSDVVY